MSVIASDRVLRWLCWSLIGFVIVSAALVLTTTQNPFATQVSDQIDYVDRLLAFRANDQKIYGLALLGSVASIGVFVIAAMLGAVLRRLAPRGAAGDVMAVVFIVAGSIGIAAQLLNIGVNQFATYTYCDCGYKTYEVISQAYALGVGWGVQYWMNIGALLLFGVATALTGRIVDLSRDFRLVSYLIALALFVSAALQFYGLSDAANILTGITAAIAVPIWAFLLARGSRGLAEPA